jgi:hypothetical protein
MPRFKVRPAAYPVTCVAAVPELIEPVSAAFSALIVVGWFPAALLIAAELVNRPFELIAIVPFAVVAVSANELVTSPPWTVIGPAIEVALPKVIEAVLVLEPMVRAVEVDAIVKLAVETAAPNEVAPVGGSMVFEPVPARLKRVKVGLYAWIITDEFDEICGLVPPKSMRPFVVPVFTSTPPEVEVTDAPFQSMS